MTFRDVLALLIATSACALTSQAAASPAAAYAYEARVEPVDGHELPPQPTTGAVRFLTKGSGADFRSLCKITIADAWVDDNPASYRRQVVEQAQRCGAPVVFVAKVKAVRGRAVVFAEGLELLSADAQLTAPEVLKPIMQAAMAGKTKTVRRLLRKLPKEPSRRAGLDNMALQNILNGLARRGKRCSSAMVKLLMDEYRVLLPKLKPDFTPRDPTWKMLLCEDVVKRSFVAASDKKAFTEEIIATYGERRRVVDIPFVRAFHNTLEPVVATTRAACAENRESELCQYGAMLKKIGTAMRDQLPASKLKPASKRVMRKLTTRMMTAHPG